MECYSIKYHARTLVHDLWQRTAGLSESHSIEMMREVAASRGGVCLSEATRTT